MSAFVLVSVCVCRCVSAQGVEFCDSPALCNASLDRYCSAHDVNCSACALKHRKDKTCAGEQSAATARHFCASCSAFLNLKCGAAKASGNRAECSKCVKSSSIKSELLYSGCDSLTTQSYCGVPAPPKPVTCEWKF